MVYCWGVGICLHWWLPGERGGGGDRLNSDTVGYRAPACLVIYLGKVLMSAGRKETEK